MSYAAYVGLLPCAIRKCLEDPASASQMLQNQKHVFAAWSLVKHALPPLMQQSANSSQYAAA